MRFEKPGTLRIMCVSIEVDFTLESRHRYILLVNRMKLCIVFDLRTFHTTYN